MAQINNSKPVLESRNHKIGSGLKSITEKRQPPKKMVSKILSDKLLLEDTMKNYKPLGKMQEHWFQHHKDPEIFESEICLSNTEDDFYKNNPKQFLNHANRKPSQMTKRELKKQDRDLTTVIKVSKDTNIKDDDSTKTTYLDETNMEFNKNLGSRIDNVKQTIERAREEKGGKTPFDSSRDNTPHASDTDLLADNPNRVFS